jgi:hypothetical protein
VLGLAAKGVASVVVSQALIACGGDSSLASTASDTTSSGSTTACVLTASLTEGPFFVDEMLNRSDIRYDPVTGALSDGVLLNLTFNVSRASNSACTPLTGAYLDVWHADATGSYSDVSGNGNGSSGSGKKLLRGYQVTDGQGVVKFTTIYPGWYQAAPCTSTSSCGCMRDPRKGTNSHRSSSSTTPSPTRSTRRARTIRRGSKTCGTRTTGSTTACRRRRKRCSLWQRPTMAASTQVLSISRSASAKRTI